MGILLCFLAALPLRTQGQAAWSFGKVDTVTSVILNERRTVWVYVPAPEANPDMTPKRFPVLYLLDGDAHFGFTGSLLKQLSEGFNHALPEMIIVGIPNTNRMRDLTPTHIRNTRTIPDSTVFRETGGGPAFLDFLEKELFPFVESKYPATPYRLLAGHSLGGLMVADAMLTRPALCQGWIAIDPSLWYDNTYLLTRLRKAGGIRPPKPSSFFMAMANNLPKGMDTLRMRRDSSAATEDNRAIQEFADLLHQLPHPSLRWTWRYYPEDDHGSVVPIALYDGLRFLFREYRLPAFNDLLEPTADPVRMLEGWSARNSAQWGMPVHPPEAFTNALGYTLMYRKLPAAEAVFRFNARAYPQSPQAWLALAAYYRAAGKTDVAQQMEAEAAKRRNAGKH